MPQPFTKTFTHRRRALRLILVLSFLILIIPSCQKIDWRHFTPHPGGKDNSAQVAIDWYTMQLRILLERNSALNGAYFAYIGIGLYEAVQPGIKNGVSLSTKLNQMPDMPARQFNAEYDWQVSANAALASLIRYYYGGLTPANNTSIDSLENAYNQKLKTSISDATFTRSQEFGRSIATAVYNWSLTDNFNPSNAGYVPPVFPGAWIPTPPAFVNGVLPYISEARPLLSSINGSKADPFPYPYSEEAGSDFYNVVKKVYDVSKALTQEEKDIASFWVDQGNGVGFTPPGHDFSIISQVLLQLRSDLFTAAEAYAKAGIAEREATIICFRSKYTYNLIRPVSYIQKVIDPAWLPFIVTPPHPEYPAAHAFVTGSVMKAVEEVLGNNIRFTDHTYDFRGWKARSFKNLFAAGEEAGISRLYGGIHYLPSIQIGLNLADDLGKKIGKVKLKNY